MKHLALALFLSAVALAACNKKTDVPPTPGSAVVAGSAAAAAAPATATAPAPAAIPPTPPSTAPVAAAAVTISSYDDYKKAGKELLTALSDTFKADGTSCDKLGDDLDKVVTDHGPTFAAIKAYETAHPDDKKKYDHDAEAKPDQTAFMTAATPALKACASNAKVKAAFTKLGA